MALAGPIMETEIVVNAEHEVMEAFEALFTKHNLAVEMGNVTVKASSKMPTRRSKTVLGSVRDVALAIVELLSVKKELKLEIEMGTTTTEVTRQDSPEKIEKTISSHKGLRLFIERETE